MNKTVKVAILSALALATTLTTVDLASARDRDYYWRHPHGRYYHHGDRAVAAGVLGLAAGAIIGGALAYDPGPEVVYRPRRVYVEPRPVYVAPARRVYAEPEYVEPDDQYGAADDAYPQPPRRDVRQVGALEPWTARWRSYCAQRYQSFNASTGTYRGYDGQDHFCTGA